MGKRLSSILFTIILLTLTTTHPASAQQTNISDPFFSFIENSLIVYIDNYNTNNTVLAAQTAQTAVQKLPTQMPITTQPQQSAQLSPVSAYLLNAVNVYRSSYGLPPVASSSETCNFAQTRAQEISSGFTHNGFYNRVNSHSLPYAQWSHATENIAQAPDYKEVVSLWANSPEHAANMRDNTPYVCIMQYESYYAYEGMRL